MSQFAEWISRIVTAWKFWVVIPPWEIGLRIRLGASAVELKPGPHWRIPFVDEILLVNTRTRITSIPTVTLRVPGLAKVNCKKAVIGFIISDPLIAVCAFENPAVAVQGKAQAEISTGLGATEVEENMRAYFKDKGIEIEFLQFTEDIEVPGLRLLQADWSVQSEYTQDKFQKRY